MRKVGISTILFVVGFVMAANGLIALIINLVIEKGLIDALIWGATAVLGIFTAAMTWRQALKSLMQPPGGRSSDG